MKGSYQLSDNNIFYNFSALLNFLFKDQDDIVDAGNGKINKTKENLIVSCPGQLNR